MLLDGLSGNGEAEAGTGGFCREVWIKYARQNFGRDARPVVLDGNDHFRVKDVAAEADNAAGSGLEGVLDQVRDGAAQHSRVSCELRRRGGRDLGPEVDATLAAVGVAR